MKPGEITPTPRKPNLWAVYQERQVSPVKEDIYRVATESDYPRSPRGGSSSPKKSTASPGKRPYLKRSAERYDPMKAVRESKERIKSEKSRERSEESASLNKSLNVSMDKIEGRSNTPDKTRKDVMSKTVGKSLFKENNERSRVKKMYSSQGMKRDNRFFERRDISSNKIKPAVAVEKPKEKANTNNLAESQKVSKPYKNVQSRVNCWITPKPTENTKASKQNLKSSFNTKESSNKDNPVAMGRSHKTSKSPIGVAPQKIKEQEEIKKKMTPASSAAQLQRSKTFQTAKEKNPSGVNPVQKDSPSNVLKTCKTMITETDKSQVSFESEI